jgi:hypothetical protein
MTSATLTGDFHGFPENDGWIRDHSRCGGHSLNKISSETTATERWIQENYITGNEIEVSPYQYIKHL